MDRIRRRNGQNCSRRLKRTSYRSNRLNRETPHLSNRYVMDAYNPVSEITVY